MMTQNDRDSDFGGVSFATTRLISRTLTLDGVPFHWWAVGESPSFVTVSSDVFGSKSEFSRGDCEATARDLARALLRQQPAKAEEMRAKLELPPGRRKDP